MIPCWVPLTALQHATGRLASGIVATGCLLAPVRGDSLALVYLAVLACILIPVDCAAIGVLAVAPRSVEAVSSLDCTCGLSGVQSARSPSAVVSPMAHRGERPRTQTRRERARSVDGSTGRRGSFMARAYTAARHRTIVVR